MTSQQVHISIDVFIRINRSYYYVEYLDTRFAYMLRLDTGDECAIWISDVNHYFETGIAEIIYQPKDFRESCPGRR